MGCGASTRNSPSGFVQFTPLQQSQQPRPQPLAQLQPQPQQPQPQQIQQPQPQQLQQPQPQQQLQPPSTVPSSTPPVHAQQIQAISAQIDSVLSDAERVLDDEELHNRYDFGKEIANGAFGRVLKATLTADATQKRAIKLIGREYDEERGEDWIFREAQILRELRHANIVSFFDVLQDADFIYIVMELCEGGDLFDAILNSKSKKFSETDAARFGGQALLALRYIHSQSIIHRDVKAENLMLTSTRPPFSIKLVDFGFSCKFTPGKLMTELCGTPQYLSPELIIQRYNCLADIWAFGIFVFLMLHGSYPFNAKEPRDIMMKIVTHPSLWRTKVFVSDTCLAFLGGVLAVAPTQRSSAREALEHIWMHQTDTSSQSEEEEEEWEMESQAVDELPITNDTIASASQGVSVSQEQQQPEEAAARLVGRLRRGSQRNMPQGWREQARRRLGDTPKDFLRKAECLKRRSRLITAPSAPQQETAERRASMVPQTNKLVFSSEKASSRRNA